MPRLISAIFALIGTFKNPTYGLEWPWLEWVFKKQGYASPDLAGLSVVLYTIPGTVGSGIKAIAQGITAIGTVTGLYSVSYVYTEGVEIPTRTQQVMENIKSLPTEDLEIIKATPELADTVRKMSRLNGEIQQLPTADHLSSLKNIWSGNNSSSFKKFAALGTDFAEGARALGIKIEPIYDPAIIANPQHTWNQMSAHNNCLEPNQ